MYVYVYVYLTESLFRKGMGLLSGVMQSIKTPGCYFGVIIFKSRFRFPDFMDLRNNFSITDEFFVP